ncbi:hypothetical protein F4778DRAFT_271115, partial [Xylariomycetidae sp. FL2044]
VRQTPVDCKQIRSFLYKSLLSFYSHSFICFRPWGEKHAMFGKPCTQLMCWVAFLCLLPTTANADCHTDACYQALFPCQSPSAVAAGLQYCSTAGHYGPVNYPAHATEACGTGSSSPYLSACACGPTCTYTNSLAMASPTPTTFATNFTPSKNITSFLTPYSIRPSLITTEADISFTDMIVTAYSVPENLTCSTGCPSAATGSASFFTLTTSGPVTASQSLTPSSSPLWPNMTFPPIPTQTSTTRRTSSHVLSSTSIPWNTPKPSGHPTTGSLTTATTATTAGPASSCATDASGAETGFENGDFEQGLSPWSVDVVDALSTNYTLSRPGAEGSCTAFTVSMRANSQTDDLKSNLRLVSPVAMFASPGPGPGRRWLVSFRVRCRERNQAYLNVFANYALVQTVQSRDVFVAGGGGGSEEEGWTRIEFVYVAYDRVVQLIFSFILDTAMANEISVDKVEMEPLLTTQVGGGSGPATASGARVGFAPAPSIDPVF